MFSATDCVESSLKSLRVLHHGLCPLDAVEIMEFFEHDLDLLAVGRVHGDEVKSLIVQ